MRPGTLNVVIRLDRRVLRPVRLDYSSSLFTEAKGRRSVPEGRVNATEMEFNEFIPKYQKGDLVGWTCSRCGWSCQRDFDLAEIDDVARARAEFLGHTCSLTGGTPGNAPKWSYFLLSKVQVFESAGVLVVDPQTVQEYGTEDEAEDAFHTFDLADFAEECRTKLQPEGHVISVSKVVSECDELGNTHEIMRDDLKL
jgi:hypothetical protein